MFESAVQYGLMVGWLMLVCIFGIGFVMVLAGRIIVRAFAALPTPESSPKPPKPELSKEERRERRLMRRAERKARYDAEIPVLGVRWRWVARSSMPWVFFAAAFSLEAIMLDQIVKAMPLRRAVQAATETESYALPYSPAFMVLIIALVLLMYYFPRLKWYFVFETAVRSGLLVAGWALALTYATAAFAVGNLHVLWAAAMVMGVLGAWLFADFHRFVDGSYVALQKAADTTVDHLGNYLGNGGEKILRLTSQWIIRLAPSMERFVLKQYRPTQ